MELATSSDRPRRFGPYRVLEALGEGAMGSVFLVEHTEDGHRAALKTAREVEQLNLVSLRREIEALGRVHHPGVVQILGHGVEDGRPWCAVEVVAGGSLREYLGRQWPSPRPDHPAPANGRLFEALRIVQELCEPLAFIHGLGMVHGDLRPANVMLDDDGVPRLLDFGLAERGGPGMGRESMRVGGAGSGTQAYMPPERIRGEIVDARADLYALGCILYELLTGLLPFQQPGGPVDVFGRMSAEPSPPSRRVAGLSAELDALVLALLAGSRRRRLGHAGEVARRLAAISGHAVSRRGPEPADYLYWPQFVGREEPLQQLQARLHDLEDGVGSVAFVVGESGVGKTRLAGELATAATYQEMSLSVSECPQTSLGGRAAPLVAFRPLFIQLLDRGMAEGRAWTDRILGDDGPVLATWEPGLAELPGQAERPEPPALSPQGTRDRLREALVRVLLRFAHDAGALLLVLDDVQWADELSLAVLADLVRRDLSHEPLLVLGTVRLEELDEPLASIVDTDGVLRMDLARMSEAAVADMLADMLALTEAPSELAGVLVEQSEGNPFFVSEILRTALDAGLLRRDEQGAWQLQERALVSARVRELDAPGSLKELVGRRLGLLGDEARACAETASVLGSSLDQPLLLRAVPGDASSVLASIQELLRRQVLRTEPGGGLRFTHGKLRELAYDAIASEARATLHERAARAYEERFSPPERDRWAPELAHHWRLAGARERALPYLEQAGNAALSAAAYEAAIGFFRQALALGEATPGLATARWESRLGEALYASSELEESETRTRAALQRLGLSTPAAAPGWGLVLLGALVRRLLPLRRVRPEDHPRLLEGSRADHRLFYLFYFNEAVLPMLAVNLRSLNNAERCGPDVADPRLYAQLGYVAGVFKLPRVARRCFDRAAELAQMRGDPGGRACALYHEALVDICLARWDSAGRVGREGVAATRAVGDGQEIELAETMVLHVELYTGDLDASKARCEMLSRISKQRANAQHEAWGYYAGARCLFVRGQFEAALADLERSDALLEGVKDTASTFISRGMRARALAELGRLDEAETHARAAMALLDGGVSSVFSTLHGYDSLAITFHRLALARGPATHAKDFARCVRGLWINAMTYPVVQPMAAYAKGLQLHARGKTSAARKHMLRSAARASALGMPPYELAAAQALIELRLVEGAAAEPWRARADALSQQLGVGAAAE